MSALRASITLLKRLPRPDGRGYYMAALRAWYTQSLPLAVLTPSTGLIDDGDEVSTASDSDRVRPSQKNTVEVPRMASTVTIVLSCEF